MTDRIALAEARAGDMVEVVGHRVPDVPRLGKILEVHGAASRPSLLVEWEDGHESLLYPGSDVAVLRGRDGG